MKINTQGDIEGHEKTFENPTSNHGTIVSSEKSQSTRGSIGPQLKTRDYLARLNPEHLRAVKYGIKPGNAKPEIGKLAKPFMRPAISG